MCPEVYESKTNFMLLKLLEFVMIGKYLLQCKLKFSQVKILLLFYIPIKKKSIYDYIILDFLSINNNYNIYMFWSKAKILRNRKCLKCVG